MPHRFWLLAAYVTLALIGCTPAPNKPLTPEDRCVLLCEGNDAGHPCRDEEPGADCVSECVDHITPLTGDCLTCVLTQSGWIAEACVCEEVDEFGMLDVTCDECSYTTHDTRCSSSDTCTRDTETCEGYTLVATDTGICEPACGG